MARSGDRTKGKLVYFTADELAAVEAAAHAAGMTAGRYVRETALGARPRARRNQVAAELVRELARIGNNINQLAHQAHAGRFPTEERLRSALDELVAKIREL